MEERPIEESLLSDPAALQELDDEQLLGQLEKVNYIAEELDAEAKIIKEILLERLDDAGLTSKIVGDWNVSKVTMIKFPGVDINKAKELSATKIVPAEEVIDTDKLRLLYKQNVPVQGVEIVVYTKIAKVKEKLND